MKKDELIEFLQHQTDFLQGKLEEALTSVRSLASANEKLTATVEELRRQIASLEEALKGKNIELSKEKTARQAMRRLQESPSERQAKQVMSSPDTPELKKERKRTNNGARKKTHPECEIETVEVEPDSPEFNPEIARYMCTCDVVRYSMIPMRFIKRIYKVKKIRSGRYDLQGQCSCNSASELTIHFIFYSRSGRTALSARNAS